jgi:hypothetical protein
VRFAGSKTRHHFGGVGAALVVIGVLVAVVVAGLVGPHRGDPSQKLPAAGASASYLSAAVSARAEPAATPAALASAWPTAAVSPGDTVLAYLNAVDDRDIALALTYLAPGSSERSFWTGSYRDSLPLPENEYHDVQCSQGTPFGPDPSARSSVGCSFNISEDWSGWSKGLVTEWGFSLEREAPGPWLIYEEGQ